MLTSDEGCETHFHLRQDIAVQSLVFHPYPSRPVLRREKISSLQHVPDCCPINLLVITLRY